MKNHGLKAKHLTLACLAPLALLANAANAANGIDAATMQKFDKVFSDFDTPKPALAVAMFRNQELVYQKAYGQASLEHKIPASRRFFNNAVAEFNAVRAQFPTVLFAGLFGFGSEKPFFQVDAADRAAMTAAPPSVKF